MNEIYSLVEKLKSDPDFVDLTDSNFGRPEFLLKSTQAILTKTFQSYLQSRFYKPDSKGDLKARQAIAKYYKTKRNFEIDPQKTIITASTSESYNLLFQSIANQGDEILIPSPGYPLFDYIIKANHLQSQNYTLKFDDNWQPDLLELQKKFNPKTKFLILITPNNPTGSVISESNLVEIFKICAKSKTNIIIDEVFVSYSNCATDYAKLANKYNVTTFLLNGISKLLALPDMKLAWITILNQKQNPDLIESLEIMNDMYLNANSYIQYALPELLNQISTIQAPIKNILKTNTATLNKLLADKPNISFIKPQGGIHAFIGIQKEATQFTTEDELCLYLLKKHKILVHPGYFYDYENEGYLWIAISLLNSPEKLVAIF